MDLFFNCWTYRVHFYSFLPDVLDGSAQNLVYCSLRRPGGGCSVGGGVAGGRIVIGRIVGGRIIIGVEDRLVRTVLHSLRFHRVIGLELAFKREKKNIQLSLLKVYNVLYKHYL